MFSLYGLLFYISHRDVSFSLTKSEHQPHLHLCDMKNNRPYRENISQQIILFYKRFDNRKTNDT